MTYRTEIEAKAMACPVARVQGDADKAGNVTPNCRGAGCIAWRWRNDVNDPLYRWALAYEHSRIKGAAKGDKPPHQMTVHKEAVKILDQSGFAHYADLEGAPERTGYCGLAGKP